MERIDVYRRLEREIELHGSLNRAARALGISPQLLSAVLSEQVSIGPTLLKALNLRVTYAEVPRARA